MAESFFKNTTVKELIPKDFKLISINEEAVVPDVLKLLIQNKILSVPVSKTKSENKKLPESAYLGIIDILDILTYMCILSQMKELIDVLSSKEVDWHAFIKQEFTVFQDLKIADILAEDGQARNPWVPVSENLSVYDLLLQFSGNPDLQRVPVINDKGEVIGFVSQTRVIEWLNENKTKVKDNLSKQIQDIKFDKKEIVTCKLSDTVLDSFSNLVKKDVMGSAVLNDAGKLVGCLSASDIKKSLYADIFKNLNLSVGDYFKAVKKENTVFSCKPSDTLQHVLDELISHKIHRVFAVDDNNKPIRIISLKDFISAII